jgi:hypothetical protein
MDIAFLLFLLFVFAMVTGFVVAIIRGKRTEHIHEGKGGDSTGWIPGMESHDSGRHHHPGDSGGHYGGPDADGGHPSGGGHH